MEFRAQRSANAAGAVSVDQLDRCIALFARNLQFMLHTQARLLHVRHAFFQVYHFHKSRFSRHARKHTADYGDSAAWKWHLAVAVRWSLSRRAAEQIPRLRQRSCWMRLERGARLGMTPEVAMAGHEAGRYHGCEQVLTHLYRPTRRSQIIYHDRLL